MYKYGFTGSPEVAISQTFGDITFVGVAIVQYSSCLLNIYILLQAPPTPSVRDILYGFFQLAPDNNVALDISFGTVGCALPLAMAFRSVCYNVRGPSPSHLADSSHQVLAVGFYALQGYPAQREGQANICTVRLPIDALSQNAKVTIEVHVEVDSIDLM